MDFDDLIRLPIKLWTEQPAARDRWQRRFEYILVDEYQDTNHAQYIMVKLLADEKRNLCVVGDPDQSIYGWRQADIRNILNFERDYPDAKVVLLEQNYRSTQMILDTAQHVIAPNTERKEKQLWTENAAGCRSPSTRPTTRTTRPAMSPARSAAWSSGARCAGATCAVMYRMNAQSRAIEQAFLGYNVPYQVVGGVRFYSRKEIKDVLALLRLTLNPFDSVSLIRAVNNTPLGRGIGAKTLADLERAAGLRGVPLYTELQLLIRPSEDGRPRRRRSSRQTANKLHPLLRHARQLYRRPRAAEPARPARPDPGAHPLRRVPARTAPTRATSAGTTCWKCARWPATTRPAAARRA